VSVRNGIKNQFCKRNEKVGRKRFKNFLCHPEISVRTPEGLSLSRVRGFTPESVPQLFEIYEPAMNTIQHNPARLYKCDKTGTIIEQHKHTKILGLKDERQISSLQSAEWGYLVTVVTCMSPTGHLIPLLPVFPRKNMEQELKNGTLPGSIHTCHPFGWMQGEIFFQWCLHFIIQSQQEKILLS
jgi:hypothetical protein